MAKVNKKSIYGAVLGLAALGFAVDRWGIGHAAEPADAQEMAAATDAPAPAPGVQAAAASAKPATKNMPATPLSTRLVQAAEARRLNLAEMGDVFATPAAWSDEKQRAAAAKLAARPDAAAEFRAKHTLNAVMKTARGGVAIVDGKAVRIGERLDTFRLTAVDAQSALFAADGAIVRMNLPGQSARTSVSRTF